MSPDLDPNLRAGLDAVKENHDKLLVEEAEIAQRRADESYFPLFRAMLIVTAVTGGLLASEKADVGPSDIVNRGTDIVEGMNGQTTEQKKAEFLFRTEPESSFVHELNAVGDIDEKTGKRIPVKVRNRPATSWSLPSDDFNIEGGKNKGELPLDFDIDKAIMFWGENPNTGDGRDRALWLAIRDSKGDIYFACADGITGLADETEAPVFNFSEVELP